MTKKILCLTLIFTAIFSACTGQPAVRVNDLGSLTAALDARVPERLAAYGVPGAALALVVDGELVWSKGYGYADLENKIPVSEETIFQVASISKTVTAWGVMRLVEQGRIELDAPAARYVTRWQLPPAEFDASGVTVRRLLSHSAGLSLSGYPGTLPERPLPSLEESLSGQTGGAGDVRLVQPPGDTLRYSGGGYTYLQLMIEEVSGLSFSEYMRQEVLAPLGMIHSSFDWLPEIRPATAIGYDSTRNALPNYLFTERAAAGLYTTASELALFGAAAVPADSGAPAGRGVLSPAAFESMFRLTSTSSGGITGDQAYGLGYFLESLPDGSLLVSHSGGNHGWCSLLMVAPAQRAALVVLTNSDNGVPLIAEVSSLWSDWLGSGTIAMVNLLGRISTGATLIVSLLAAGLAVRLWWLTQKMRSGQRRISFRLRIGMVVGLVLALAWAALWLYAGPQIPNVLLPTQGPWLMAVMLLWAASTAWGALLEQVRAAA